MNVLQKCCVQTIKKNPRRTLVTVIGIITSTALIMVISTLFLSIRETWKETSRLQSGDYHYLFQNVSRDNLHYFEHHQNLESYGIVYNAGCAAMDFQRSEKRYVCIKKLGNEDTAQRLSLRVDRGRLPQTDDEILLSHDLYMDGAVRWEVGDRITLAVGERSLNGAALNMETAYTEGETLENVTEKTYTIVGIAEWGQVHVDVWSSPAYCAYTVAGDEELPETVDVYAKYTKWGLNHHEQVTSGILGISEELFYKYFYIKRNGETVFQPAGGWDLCTNEEREQAVKFTPSLYRQEDLVHSYLFRLSDLREPQFFWSLGLLELVVLVIMLVSILSIRNSFAISLAEKSKLYGRLSSVGMTRRQMRGMVYREALILGGAGIPVGILLGIFGAKGVLALAQKLVLSAYGYRIVFRVSWVVLVFSVLQAAITVYLSALESAYQAGRIMPMELIRGSRMVSNGKRVKTTPKWVKKLFGVGGCVAYQNLNRAKDKYRTLILAIVGSVATFIALPTFGYYSRMQNEELLDYKFQISITMKDEESDLIAQKIVGMEDVQRWQLSRLETFTASTDNIPYTKDGEKRRQILKGWNNIAGNAAYFQVMTLGEQEYERFCKQVGVSVEEARGKWIIVAFQKNKIEQFMSGEVHYFKQLVDFKEGDQITATLASLPYHIYQDLSEEEREYYREHMPSVTAQVLCQTKKEPLCVTGKYGTYGGFAAITSEEWLAENLDIYENNYKTLYLNCKNANQLEKELQETYGKDLEVWNYDAMYRSNMGSYWLISIGLYGFMGMLSLVGITNIFNTVTTNMELRAPQFAMLSCVGMTRGQLHKMIALEGVFYGGKAFAIATCLGVAMAYGIYVVMNPHRYLPFQFPIVEILISAACLWLLLSWITRYSIRRFEKRNLVETVRDENS